MQLKLFKDYEGVNESVTEVSILGWVSMPMLYSIIPTIDPEIFVAKKRLPDGYPMRVLVRKIDDKTYTLLKHTKQ